MTAPPTPVRVVSPPSAAPDAGRSTPHDGTTRLQVHATYSGRVPPDFAPLPESVLSGSLTDLLERAVALYAERVAVVEPARTLTHATLNTEANAYAHALLARLGDGEEPVAIVMNLDDAVFPALFGTLKAGKLYAFLDPAEPPARLCQLLERLEARAVIVAARHVPLVTPHLRAGQTLLVDAEIATSPQHENPGLALAPERGAAIFFTSGSTGVPKGVLTSHASLVYGAYLNVHLYCTSASDRQAVTAFPGFSTSAHNSLGALAVGGAVYPLNPQNYTATQMLAALRDAAISILSPAPTLARALLDAAGDDAHLPALRLVTLAGQSIQASDLAHYRRVLGPHIVFAHTYGSSEAGRIATGFIDAQTPLVDARVPVGYPTGDTQVRILDETGQVLGAEQVGEVVVISRYMASGYWRDEAGTQARFSDDPDTPGLRRYATGDLGLLRDDGCLELHGRADSMVKVRGYRVELGAIEAALLRHPDVLHAAAVTHQLPHGELTLVAYATPKGGVAPTPAELRAHLAAQLPAYMLPARLVVLETMPLTPTGKVDRRALPPPGNRRPDLATAYAPPETQLQSELAELCAEVLALELVGLNDSFIELGGDSLRVVRVLAQVERRYGRAIPVAAWLVAPTVRRLADLVDRTEVDHNGTGYNGTVRQESLLPMPNQPATPQTRTAASPTSAPHRLGLVLRALHRFSYGGPVLGQIKIPYAVGNRLRLAWLRRPWVRQVVLAEAIDLFERWRSAAQLDDQDGRLLEHFLFNNTWRDWHAAHLRDTAIWERWVTVEGLPALTDLARSGRGAVIAFFHMGLKGGLVTRALKEQVYREVTSLPGIRNAASAREALIRRAELVQQTGAVLARGGAVLVAGDGLHGTDGVVYPFHGRRITFYRGGAHLAVTHHAALVPVFQEARCDGRVRVEFLPPLFPLSHGSETSRVDELLDRYVQVVTAHWPRILPAKGWNHLRRWWAASAPLEG